MENRQSSKEPNSKPRISVIYYMYKKTENKKRGKEQSIQIDMVKKYAVISRH